MNIEAHYNNLYETSIQKINDGEYQTDHLINSTEDNRFGITLLIRPSIEVKNEIQKFISKLRAVDRNQYYYKNSDIHITVMSIISCYDGFNLKNIDLSKYISVINESLIENPEIEINFKGITASPSCLMIQGFMNNDALNMLRNNLRERFKNTTLEQSLDKRYAIQTAHSTVVRFKEQITNKPDFLKEAEAFRNYNFGSFKVEKIELVYNDWYHKEEQVKTLFEFDI